MITKKQVEKVIKEKFDGECNLQNIQDLDTLFGDLESEEVFNSNVSIVGVGNMSGDDWWLECHLYSKKLG